MVVGCTAGSQPKMSDSSVRNKDTEGSKGVYLWRGRSDRGGEWALVRSQWKNGHLGWLIA